MREDQLPRCADLLADTFVDTKGIQAYRWAPGRAGVIAELLAVTFVDTKGIQAYRWACIQVGLQAGPACG
jgi:hypothetical protein